MASPASRKGVRVLRFGLSGAAATTLIFVGLWTAAQLPMGPSDLILELFTTRAPTTTAGLQEGVLYAALIGFFAGAIVNFAYEALQWLEQTGGRGRTDTDVGRSAMDS